MSKSVSVGIDVGTHEVKVAVAESTETKDKILPKILGVGVAEAKGIRRGYIVNSDDVTRSIAQAVRKCEKSSGVKIKRAYLSVGGIGLQSVMSTGSIIISRADSEITDLDVSKAIANSEKDIPKQLSINKKVIHTIPVQYRIDGKLVFGRPHGMKAMKLEVKTLFIICTEQHINDLIQCVEELGIEVEDVIASPIAASLVALNKLQKVAGCVLANIGSETVSIVVFENNIPISLEVFPIGSTDITNDIALGLKTSLEEAEDIKRQKISEYPYSKKKIDEIIEARLSDIFELIDSHLKKIGRSQLLPAGIVLIGGGSLEKDMEDFAKSELKLPSKIGKVENGGNTPVNDLSFAVAYGLCLVGYTNTEENEMGLKRGLRFAKTGGRRVISWIKQFLP